MKIAKTLILIAVFISLGFSSYSQSKALQSKLDTLTSTMYLDTIPKTSKIQLCDRIIELAKKEKNIEAECWALMNIGVAYYRLNAFKQSFEFITQAKELLKKVDDDIYHARMALLLGNYYHAFNDDKEALRFYESAFPYLENLESGNVPVLVYISYSNVVIFADRENGLEKSRAALRKAEKNLPNTDHDYYSTLYHGTMAQYYLEEGSHLDSVIIESDILINLATKIGNMELLSIAYYFKGDVAMIRDQYELALEHFLMLDSISLEFNIANRLQLAASNLASVYHYLKKYDLSNEYWGKALRRQDSVLKNKSNLKIHELEELFSSREKDRIIELDQAQLKKYEVEQKYARNRFIVLLVGSIIVVLGGYVWIRNYRISVNRRRELQKIQSKLLESEIEREKVEKQRLEQEINFKNADLTNFAIELTSKGDLMNATMAKLKTIKKSDTESEREEEINELYDYVQSQMIVEKSLIEFHDQVDDVNESFYRTLEKEFPKLSLEDRKICGLIRLNLSNKEIAMIRNVEVDSAKTSRYRIRKKMGLDSDQDIQGYLSSL